MPSKYLSDADFVKPLTDADFEPAADSALQTEMAPDLHWYDRAAVKNFGTNPADSAAYLQKKYPDYKVSAEGNDLYLSKDGKKYPLDPDTGLISKDIGYDVLDFPADIAKGVGTTAASAAAGLAAAPAGGIGAIPAAMTAGGATAGSLEALRQKIGQAIGVNKPTDILEANDPNSIAMDTATGALSPLFFGTGATGVQIAKQGLTGEAFKDLTKSQQGLIARAWPGLLSKMSGISKPTIETAKDNMPMIKALENNPESASTLGEEAVKDFGKIKQSGKNIGKGIEAARETGGNIPLEASQDVIDSEIRNLEKIASEQSLTPAQDESLQALRDLKARQFGDKTMATAPDSLSIKTSLRNAGETEPNQIVANAAKRASGVLGSTETKMIPKLAELNPQYADVQSLLEKVGNAADDKNAAYNFLRTLGSKSKQGLAEDIANADKTHGTDLVKKAHLAAAFDVFRKSQPFQMGRDAFVRRLPAEAAGGYLGYKAGGWPGAAAGMAAGGVGASPQGIRVALQGQNLLGPVAPYATRSVLPIWDLLRTQGRGGE